MGYPLPYALDFSSSANKNIPRPTLLVHAVFLLQQHGKYLMLLSHTLQQLERFRSGGPGLLWRTTAHLVCAGCRKNLPENMQVFALKIQNICIFFFLTLTNLLEVCKGESVKELPEPFGFSPFSISFWLYLHICLINYKAFWVGNSIFREINVSRGKWDYFHWWQGKYRVIGLGKLRENKNIVWSFGSKSIWMKY